MWLVWILLIAIIIWGVKSVLSTSNNPPETKQSALDLLKERYARGEIDHDEFEQKKKDLQE